MSKICNICESGLLDPIQETRTTTLMVMGKEINFTHTYNEEYCPECELIYTSSDVVHEEMDAYLKCLSEHGVSQPIIDNMREKYLGDSISNKIASKYKPVDYTGIEISSPE